MCNNAIIGVYMCTKPLCLSQFNFSKCNTSFMNTQNMANKLKLRSAHPYWLSLIIAPTNLLFNVFSFFVHFRSRLFLSDDTIQCFPCYIKVSPIKNISYLYFSVWHYIILAWALCPCVSNKYLPVLCSNLLYKLGHYFMDI